jgi:hypothetical protein
VPPLGPPTGSAEAKEAKVNTVAKQVRETMAFIFELLHLG